MQHLDQNSPAIRYLCQRDKHLAKVIRMVGPLDYQLATNGYADLAIEIVGQMLSNKVAAILIKRLEALCQPEITPTTITALTDDQIRSIGLSHAKVGYIRNLTASVNAGTISFDHHVAMSDQAIIQELTQVKGIGNWSAKMYLIFSLDRPDVLPYEDLAFLQAYGWIYKTDNYSARSVQKKCRKWRPYCSIAARYLYRALDNGLTNEPFHLFK